jgi:hypothetical protein
MSPVANVIGSFGVKQLQYADDTQLYVALSDDKKIPTLTKCFAAVHHWLDMNGLSLNPDKTEAIVIGTGARNRTEGAITAVSLGDVTVQPSGSVKSLGVIIDDTLSFNEHINNVCRSSNYHIRALRHIRKFISQETANSVACAIVHSRLDYCNSLLVNTTATNINKLQRTQNSLARVVTGSRRSGHITPVLAALHWLPIQHRVLFKVAVITYNVLTTHQPGYLSELLQFKSSSRQLRSSCRNELQVATTKLKFADRAFQFAAPTIWNSLPSNITSNMSSLAVFKRCLKTELYSRAFRH